jgi:hypothetical protein
MIVAGVLVMSVAGAYVRIGLPPVVILDGSGLVPLLLYYRTCLKQPTEPTVVLPAFLITVAGFEIHLVEEYFAHQAPAIRLFNIGWAERSFLVISFLLAATLALYHHRPLLSRAVHRFHSVVLFC